MNKAIACFMLASASAALAGDERNLDFKGVPLGTTLSDFRSWAHPDGNAGTRVACTGETVRKIGRTEITAPGTAVYDDIERGLGVTKCIWVHAVEDRKNFKSAGSVAPLLFASSGFAAYDYSFAFIPDPVDGVPKFYKAVAISNRQAYGDVLEALTAKYGDPVATTGSVQNGMGADFPQTTAIWEGENQSILVEDRFTKIDNMVVIVTDHRLAKPIKDADEAKKAKQVNAI